MTVTIDYRQQLLQELNGLSPLEIEKIYHMVVFIKQEFLAVDEARYTTPGWIQAEQEATEAYIQGHTHRFSSVRELAEHIESQPDEPAK